MKRLSAVALVMFWGCVEINTLEVEFSTNNSVVANGEEFVLDTREDGFMMRSRFPAAEKIIFKGLGHCRMSAVWNLIDVRRPKKCLTRRLSCRVGWFYIH